MMIASSQNVLEYEQTYRGSRSIVHSDMLQHAEKLC